MTSIEVFADVVCPFTHVGLRRLVSRRTDLGVDRPLHVRAWPLEIVNGEPLGAAKVAEEIAALRAEVAPDMFKGFDPATWPRTSLPALALTAEAYRVSLEVGERVAFALRDALFEEGRDISARIVIEAIAADHGLELPAVGDDARVFADHEEGKARGVQGSPHFFTSAGGFFCPGLHIVHDEGGFQVTADTAAFGAFVHSAFGLPNR